MNDSMSDPKSSTTLVYHQRFTTVIVDGPSNIAFEVIGRRSFWVALRFILFFFKALEHDPQKLTSTPACAVLRLQASPERLPWNTSMSAARQPGNTAQHYSLQFHTYASN
jgi:hypothetical protein